MSLFLQPAELNLIARDMLDLIRGPDGTPVVLHWAVETGARDVYGKAASTTWATLAVRAHLAPVIGKTTSGKPVHRSATADVQDGDTIFLFEPSVDLTGKPQLWFEVPGLGNFVPEAKPPTGADKHVTMFPAATTVVQQIYCNAKRG